MILCLDVAYGPGEACTAGVVIQKWSDPEPFDVRIARIDKVEPYESGSFYRRELPCLLPVIHSFENIDVIVIDGYVWLDAAGKKGLGAFLYESIERNAVVIGVAKSQFRNTDFAVAVQRGKSHSPIYVTAAGMDVREAASHIHGMHGPYRIPTAIKRADQLCRRGLCA